MRPWQRDWRERNGQLARRPCAKAHACDFLTDRELVISKQPNRKSSKDIIQTIQMPNVAFQWPANTQAVRATCRPKYFRKLRPPKAKCVDQISISKTYAFFTGCADWLATNKKQTAVAFIIQPRTIENDLCFFAHHQNRIRQSNTKWSGLLVIWRSLRLIYAKTSI